MTYIPAKLPRTFIIYEEPHVADPAWVLSIVEIIDLPSGSIKRIIEAPELAELVTRIHDTQMQIEYENRGRNEALKTMGIPLEEYIRHRAEYEARKTEG